MLDDFTPIIHELPGRTIRVWAVADVHIGAKEARLDDFRSFLSKIAQDEDSYLVLCGDLLNFGVKNSVTNVYEETMPPQAQIDYAAELFEPISDRILGVVGGNHEHRGVKEVGLCPLLQVMTILRKSELYRQNIAFMRVNLANGNTKDHYALMLTHGKTAYKKKQLSYAVEGVDAIISGHTHDGLVEKPARISFNQRNVVSMKSIVSLTATSWLDYGGYAARSLLLPKTVCDPQCLVLEYTASNNSKGRIRVAW